MLFVKMLLEIKLESGDEVTFIPKDCILEVVSESEFGYRVFYHTPDNDHVFPVRKEWCLNKTCLNCNGDGKISTANWTLYTEEDWNRSFGEAINCWECDGKGYTK